MKGAEMPQTPLDQLLAGSAATLPAGFGGLPVPGAKAAPKCEEHGLGGKTPEQAAKAEAKLHCMYTLWDCLR